MNDNQAILLFIAGTFLLNIFVFVLILFLIIHKKKRQKDIEEKRNLTHQFESQLLQSKLEVQEQAFKYFSEEIHDNIGQKLMVSNMNLYQLGNSELNEEQRELVAGNTSLISETLADLRNISHSLNGVYIARTGLQEALQKEIKYISTAKKINAELQVSGESISMDAGRELLIFRIVQEAITNTIKHASASCLVISLHFNGDLLYIQVKDNGIGIADNAKGAKGLGLANMQLRAELLNGELAIDSNPEGGTIIGLTLSI